MPGGVRFAVTGIVDQDLIVATRFFENAIDGPQGRMAWFVDEGQRISEHPEIRRSQSFRQSLHVVLRAAQGLQRRLFWKFAGGDHDGFTSSLSHSSPRRLF